MNIFNSSAQFENLNSYDSFEIQKEKITDIYFVGHNEKRINPMRLIKCKNEKNITDDEYSQMKEKYFSEKGYYIVNTGDHINYRYEIIKQLGSGSFSDVVKCKDYKLNKFVALKISLKTPKRNQILEREIKILNYIHKSSTNAKERIIELLDQFVFRDNRFYAMELCSISLYDYLTNEMTEDLTENSAKKIMLQILEGLNFLHKLNIVHCDMKPDNFVGLSMYSSPEIKIIDFGLSCFEEDLDDIKRVIIPYRAPEIHIGLKQTKALDLWSIGVVLYNILTKNHLVCCNSEISALNIIADVIGPPEKEHAQDWFQFSNQAYYIFRLTGDLKYKTCNHLPGYPVTLKERLAYEYNFGQVSDDCLDFLNKCLTWNSKSRITCEEALTHPWLRPKPAVRKELQEENSSIFFTIVYAIIFISLIIFVLNDKFNF